MTEELAPQQRPETLLPLPRQQRRADSVHATLRDAILSGGLPPGSRLSVPLLAQQLDVSRSPVREAVQRLVQDGLASEEPHRGAAVAMLDPVELLPLYEVREVLEGLAARLAATEASEQELDQLAAAHREHAAALERGDSAHHASLDLAFHARVRAAAHNDELARYLSGVQGRIAIAIVGGRPGAWSEQAIVEHQAVLDAVLTRDPDRAESAARDHIRRIRADIAALHPQDPGRDDLHGG